MNSDKSIIRTFRRLRHSTLCAAAFIIWFTVLAGAGSAEEFDTPLETAVITTDGPACDVLDRRIRSFRITNGADSHAIAALEGVGGLRICQEFHPDDEGRVKYYVDDQGHFLFASKVLININMGTCSVREALLAIVEKTEADHAEIVVGTNIVNFLSSPSRLRVRVGDVVSHDYDRQVLRDAGRQRMISFFSSMPTSGLVGDKIRVRLRNPTAQELLNAVVATDSKSKWNVKKNASLKHARFIGQSNIHSVDINIVSVRDMSQPPKIVRGSDVGLQEVLGGHCVVWSLNNP